MREPPNLPQERIVAALYEQYGIAAAEVNFLPLGNDNASAPYRVTAGDGTRYFLKVRAPGGFGAASVAVPHFLYQKGLTQVVAPIPTLSGALVVQLGSYVASLYPFLNAQTARQVGLSLQQWHEFGVLMRAVHATELPQEIAALVPHGSFVPDRRNLLDTLEIVLTSADFQDPARLELAAFWRTHAVEIHNLVLRTDKIARKVQQSQLPFVLCHADMHVWNLLVESTGSLALVDWDEVRFAPKERDLMFVIGSISRGLVKKEESAAFLEGYGQSNVNDDALLYYRHAWAVQDVMAYAEAVFLIEEMGAENRREAANGFMVLFEPGAIISIARDSDL